MVWYPDGVILVGRDAIGPFRSGDSRLWYVLRTAPVFSFLLTCFKGSIDKLASFGLKYMLDELFSRLSRSSLSDNSLSVD